MSADELRGLIDEFTTYFVDLYRREQPESSAQPLLLPMPMGLPVSADELRLHPSDPEPSPALAVEWMSTCANEVPDIDGLQLFRTARAVDGLYELLLRGAQMPAGTDAAALALFEGAKARALRALDQATLGTMQGLGSFHPVVARPAAWASPAASDVWTERTFRSSTRTTPGPRPLPPIATPPWQLQVVPAALVPALAEPHRMADALAQLRPVADVRAVTPRAPAVATMRVAPQLGSAKLASKARMVAPQAVRLARPSALSSKRVEAEDTPSARMRALAVSEKQLARTEALTRNVALIEVAEPRPSEASDVSLSFEYCLVALGRPWLDLSFLSLPGWFVPGFRRGDFSSGQIADPASADTLFEALPTAALLVRRLELKAAWSHEELAVLEGAAAFGPFSLLGRRVDMASGSVRCDGTQLVAWVCEPLPVLPPASAPGV